jgi:acetolactate synthase I/II/III large subunit
MNGAESLVASLVASDVKVCFANPGTSEMHFVAALDRVEGMRCVLGLAEGVVTGAADGYARMTDSPACTLLHLGPGLANGLSNIHNAKKAASPMVNIVGEHATYHIEYDAPLTADIEGIAAPMSHWVHTSRSAADVAAAGARAVEMARTAPGQIATLILPADTAWNEGGPVVTAAVSAGHAKVGDAQISSVMKILRSGEPTLLYLTGHALRQEGLEAASRIAEATGAKVMAQWSNARLQRGAGRPSISRVPFVVDQALDILKEFKHVILVGTKPPVAFFAYPNKPSLLAPESCEMLTLSGLEEDGIHALEWLVDELGIGNTEPQRQALNRPALPTGALTKDNIAAVIGAMLPEDAIVADESVTTGRGFYPLTAGAPPHDWMQNLGGSIGMGMPLATGAAIAAPGRKTFCFTGDGSAMYTLQALWTQAREGLDVTTVVFANRSYDILLNELANVGAGNAGRKALDMLDLRRPDIGWVNLARGMGVEAVSVTDSQAFAKALAAGTAVEGPYLIEVVI